MSDHPPTDWHRAKRSDHDLSTETGVYALFLRQRSRLPGIDSSGSGLLYIGKAGGEGGFLQRCHFHGSTRNHSPRKSLAVLLMDELALRPIRIDKPNGPHTWSLDRPSEDRLTAWMIENLDLAIEIGDDPDSRETEIVESLAPPLNLTKCGQTDQHRRIAQARRAVWLSVDRDEAVAVRNEAAPIPERVAVSDVRPNVVAQRTVETAEEMAVRYGLLAKSFRSSLRRTIGWYAKPQIWEFPIGSRQHRDMEAVAMRMAGRAID